jgi:RimJ/RimL family protein N-acetyltransferase
VGQDGAVITVRSLGPDQWETWRDLRLAALSDSPDAFSADPAHWQGDNDTEPRWRKRLSSVPYNAVAELTGDGPVGMVSATDPDGAGSVELISMWVAPSARGKGVGEALVEAVAAWARSVGAHRVVLRVFEANARAQGLYRRSGFNPTGAFRSEPGAPDEMEMARLLTG